MYDNLTFTREPEILISIELGYTISDFRVIGFINKGYMNIIPADQVDGEESVNNFAMGLGLSYMF